MQYHIQYINLKFDLINCFLLKADKPFLDISYSIDEKKLTIQVVMLQGYTLSQERIDSIKGTLVGLDVDIIELYLTKDQFNGSKGEWYPRLYKWLDYLLFSKAEVL